MHNYVFLAPSFYAHIINGLLLFVAFIILYKNYSKISNLDPYRKIIITLFFSIGLGVHGLSHLGLESVYGFTPFYFK